MYRPAHRRLVFNTNPINIPDPHVLKIRKNMNIPKSQRHLLFQMKIDPVIMRNTLKKSLSKASFTFKIPEASLPANTAYICPYIRKLVITGVGNDTETCNKLKRRKNLRKLSRFLKRCNRLECFQSNSSSMIGKLQNDLKFIHKLKFASLIIDKDEVLKCRNIFKKLRYLTSLNLTFIRDNFSWGQRLGRVYLSLMCADILNLRQLNRLKLDFKVLDDAEDILVLESLLLSMRNPQLEFFCVQISYKFSDTLYKSLEVTSRSTKDSLKETETTDQVDSVECEKNKLIANSLMICASRKPEGVLALIIEQNYDSPADEELLRIFDPKASGMCSLEGLKVELGKQNEAPLRSIRTILNSFSVPVPGLNEFEITITDNQDTRLDLNVNCSK